MTMKIFAECDVSTVNPIGKKQKYRIKVKKLTTKRLISLSYLQNQRQKRPTHLTNVFLRISS